MNRMISAGAKMASSAASAVEARLNAAEEREEAALEAFAKADADGSGFIERGELEAVLRETESERVRDFVSSAFDVADTSGDGKISFDEFVAVFNKMTDWMHARHASVKLAAQQAQIVALQHDVERLQAQNSTLQIKVAQAAQAGAPQRKRRVPKPGDHVIAHQINHHYYPAKVNSFDADAREFTVDWDDGDERMRVQAFDKVCLDRTPDPEDFAIGSQVLFAQGKYKFGEQVHDRWYEGRVTAIERDNGGATLYRGEHMRGEKDGLNTTYRGYAHEWLLPLKRLRVAPNLLDLMSAPAYGDRGPSGTEPAAAIACDVYVSHSPVDRASALKFGAERAFNPIEDMVTLLRDAGLTVVHDTSGGTDLELSMSALQSAKVVVAALSDAYAADRAAVQELQYAKKTLHKSVVPVIVGEKDESWEFMASLVGLLIAGELYIDFRQRDKHDDKCAELLTTVKGLMRAPAQQQGKSRVVDSGPTRDVFVSYCWHNSALAHEAQQVPALCGPELADPRRLAKHIAAAGLTPWLDIEVLGGGSGLFTDIARGLKAAKVVVACVSTEYARSDNCRMELQYAVKQLKKPCVVVVVGADNEWQETVVGLVTGGLQTVQLSQRVQEGPDDEVFDAAADEVLELVRSAISPPDGSRRESAVAPAGREAAKAAEGEAEQDAAPSRRKEPRVGDHVIAHHWQHNYYEVRAHSPRRALPRSGRPGSSCGPGALGSRASVTPAPAHARVRAQATVAAFDASTAQFTLAWDDGDKSGTVQPYELVCVDAPPSVDEVGVGTVVLFPQGKYFFIDTEGVRKENLDRFHEGAHARPAHRSSARAHVHRLSARPNARDARRRDHGHQARC